MKRPLLSLTFVFIAAAGFCQQFSAKGFRFEVIDPAAATCKVTGVSEDESSSPEPEKTFFIPEIVYYDGTKEMKVVEIGPNAFTNNTYSDIEIHAGIVKIGEYAFGNNTSPNSYNVRFAAANPDSESPQPLEVAFNAFPGATTLYLGRNLTSTTQAFECPRLSILTAGKDVAEIPAGAFPGLSNIILEKGCQAEFTSSPLNENVTVYVPEDYSKELSGNIVRYKDADLEVESITIYPSTLEIECCQTSRLMAEVYPDNNATLVWTSSDPRLLTVDNSGEITANREYRGGNVVISAHALNGVSASAEITVKSPLSFDSSKKLDLFLGETVAATVSLGIHTNENFDSGLLSFDSSDSGVVSVVPQENGGNTEYFLNGKASGETYITVRYDGSYIGDIAVTVWERPQGMEIDADYRDITRLIWKKESNLIPVRFTPDHKYVWKDVSASIDDGDIADVNVETYESTGETYLSIRHKKGGDAVITVTAHNGKGTNPVTFSESVNLKVMPYFDITELNPKKGVLYLNRRKTLQMSATIDNPECMEYLEWSVRKPDSSAPSKGIATIDATGLITAENYGKVLVGVYCYPEFLNGSAKFLYKVLNVVRLPLVIDPYVEEIEVKKKHTFTILIKHWFKHDEDDEEDEDDKKHEICNDFYVSVDDESVASAKITRDSTGSAAANINAQNADEDDIQSGDYLTVEGLNAGTTNVTISSPNGVSVTIPVTVTSETTGIGSVISEKSPFKVYSVSGVLLRDSASKADIEALPSGAYIIEQDGQTFKVIL